MHRAHQVIHVKGFVAQLSRYHHARQGEDGVLPSLQERITHRLARQRLRARVP